MFVTTFLKLESGTENFEMKRIYARAVCFHSSKTLTPQSSEYWIVTSLLGIAEQGKMKPAAICSLVKTLPSSSSQSQDWSTSPETSLETQLPQTPPAESVFEVLMRQ